MERTERPRRPEANLGDAVCFLAALLGVVLLVAAARHLFWSDESAALAPLQVIPLAQVAPAAAPPVARTRAGPIAAHGQRAWPGPGRRGAPREGSPRHGAARQVRLKAGPQPFTGRASRERDRPAVQRNVRPSRTDLPTNGSQHRIASRARPATLVTVRSSRAIAPANAHYPQTIAKRSDVRLRPVVHPAVARARPNVRIAQKRSQPHDSRIAVIPQRSVPTRPSLGHSAAPAAQHAAARTAFVATRAERRARARQAAILEPPLGYQPHVTLVEVPAALALDLGRDPIPALQIRFKHRH